VNVHCVRKLRREIIIIDPVTLTVIREESAEGRIAFVRPDRALCIVEIWYCPAR